MKPEEFINASPRRQWVRSTLDQRAADDGIVGWWRFHDGRKEAAVSMHADGSIRWTARVKGDVGDWHRAPNDDLDAAWCLAETALETVEVLTTHLVDDDAALTHCGLPDAGMTVIPAWAKHLLCEVCLRVHVERLRAEL